MARKATVERVTRETDISIAIDLDGTGETRIETGIGFFDHMLEAFGRHGLIDLDVKAKGDLHVDGHHTVEDVGIVLGQALACALGDKRGIVRYGDIVISGRGALQWDMDVPYQMVGSFDSTLAREFFTAFATNAGITLHLRQLAGDNVHHVIEAAFKACARALRAAVASDPRAAGALPTTKGAL